MTEPHPENTDFVRRILAQRREAAWQEHKQLVRRRDTIQEQAWTLSAEVSVLDSALEVLAVDAALGDSE